MHARTRTALPFALALGFVAVAQPARAQESTLAPAAITAPAMPRSATPAPAVVTAPSTGPTADAATVGVRHQAEAEPVAAQRRGGTAPGTALMIVGGAAILVGIVVGGDAGHAISIGGAVVGLVGLYQYLQ